MSHFVHRCKFEICRIQRCDQRNVVVVTASSGTRVWVIPKPTRTPLRCLCRWLLRATKPKDSAYPQQIKTLGDKLRARRLDLGLLQKDVARMLGVTEDSVINWA